MKGSSRLSRPLIIGVGNPHRSDDAIGPLVAKRFEALHGGKADTQLITGDCTALVDLLAERDAIVIVDACLSGVAPGTVHRFDVVEATLPAYAGGVSTHGFGVAEALALAKTLDCTPQSCVVYAIEGAEFEPGERLSPAVKAALDTVVESVADELAVLSQ